MFNRLLQITLVITSLSPVLLTFWFKDFSKNWNFTEGIYYLFLSAFLLILLSSVIFIAKKKLEIIPISISEISNADNESIIFIFTYLVPLLEIDIKMIIFLLILFLVILLTTNIYHFNPMLGLLGYHQYQVKLSNGTTFILITKKNLINTKQIKNVVQLTNYILLEN